jgi:alpha-D-ribose 1-methylphosphonate 5-triphosphate synthase subunit PhnH
MTMNHSSTPLLPGLPDPVSDSQQVFRAVLDALSRPGSLQSLSVLPPAPPPLAAATGALLLALADADTPLWLAPSVDSPEVRAWVTFHCGAPWAETPAQATYAVFSVHDPLPALAAFGLGTAEAPQLSTTILMQGVHFGDAAFAPWSLRGPGIADRTPLCASPLPAGFADLWAENSTSYPQGIDALLLGENTLCGLSRTTALTSQS